MKRTTSGWVTFLTKFWNLKYIIYILSSPDPYKGALKNLFRHVLYFDSHDKTGIETLLLDEDDIERDRESLMHFVKFLYEDNQAHFCKITWSFS